MTLLLIVERKGYFVNIRFGRSTKFVSLKLVEPSIKVFENLGLFLITDSN